MTTLKKLTDKFWSLRDKVTYKYGIRIESILIAAMSLGGLYMITKFIIGIY